MSTNKSSDLEEQDAEEEEDEEQEEEEIKDPRTIATLYLGAIARDGHVTPYDKIAEDMDIPVSQADAIITQCVQNMVGTHKEHDFPARLLQYYNEYAPDEEDKLTVEDVIVLMKLVDRFFTKITPKQKEQIKVKMKQMGTTPPGFDPRQYAKTIPSLPEEEEQVVFADSQSGAVGVNQPVQQPIQQARDPYAPYESDEALMKSLLEMSIGIREPSRIQFFLQSFRMNKSDWLQNPVKLLVSLKGTFGDKVAESVMMQFMDTKAKMPTTASALYRITGASSYNPIVPPESYLGQANPAMAQFVNEFGSSNPNMVIHPPGANPVADPLDTELQRLSKIISMGMMKNMAEGNVGGQGQQGQNGQSDADRHEIYDAAGRLTEVRYVKRAWPYGPPPSQTNPNDKSQEMFMKFVELMMTSQNQNQTLLMNKLLSGDGQGLNEIVNTILKQAVGAMTQTTDPVQNLNKFLELGDKVAQLKQQPQKTADERKIEMDYILAKNEQQYAEAEKMRQFQREQAEANAADQRYHDTVREVGNVIKEAAGPLLDLAKNTIGRGLGGNMPGMYPPPGVMQQSPPPQKVIVQQVPVQVPQQQPQYTPEQIRLMQQEEMRRRQAMQAQIEQEQRMANRPIDEVLAEMSNEEIEEMSRRYEEDSIKLEHTGNKILAEAARRKGRAYIPNRRHVAPIVQAVKQHHEQQQMYANQPPVQEESINVFEEPEPFQMQEPLLTSPTSTAADISNSYNDPDVKASMIDQGLLPDDDDKIAQQTNLGENTSIGVPGSVSMQSTVKEVQEPELEIDESELVDTGETTIE